MITNLYRLALLMARSVSSFAQQNDSATPLSRENYLKKSKSQKTAAYILLGGGSALLGAGIAIGFNEAVNAFGNIFSPDEVSTSSTGEVLFYTGLVAMAGSVPLFIASTRNKKKSTSLSALFKMEHRSILQQRSQARTSFPALGLKLAF